MPDINDPRQRLLQALMMLEDPYGLQYGLGPVTPMSRAGMLPEGELRAHAPSPGEEAAHRLRSLGPIGERAGPVAQALLDYGPEPAKAYVGQIDRSARALSDATDDPSLANVADAGVQTGIAVAPTAMLRGAGVVASIPARYPATTGAAVGAGTYFGDPGQAGAGEETDRIKDLQMQLRDAGLYSGPIDGVIEPGGPTARAKAEFDRMQLQQQQLELEQQRVQSEREQAGAAKAESDRKRLEMEQRAKERAAGETRMRDLEENLSPISKAIRDYSTTGGYATGVVAGLLTRRGVPKFMGGKGGRVGAMERESAATAQRADALMQGPRRDVPDRVGKVNQFWEEGGAGAARPFSVSPGSARGYSANPQAAPASGLYPTPRKFRGSDAAVVGGFGGEAALSYVMAKEAEQKVDDARARVRQDPSEVNIRELNAAINKAALWEGGSRFGVGGVAGYGAGMFKGAPRYSRPNIAEAEAERIRLERLLTSGTSPSSPPSPVAAALTSRTVIRRGRSGRTWHDESGQFTSPPKKPKK